MDIKLTLFPASDRRGRPGLDHLLVLSKFIMRSDGGTHILDTARANSRGKSGMYRKYIYGVYFDI